MNNGSRTWFGNINEDGGYSTLARVTSLDATGEEYLAGEGPVLQQSDISSITCRVYDLFSDKDATSGVEITPAPTVTISTSIFNTLRRTGWPLPPEGDTIGYNFRFDIESTYTPNADHWYLVEFKFTLTGGGVIFAKFKVYTEPIAQS